MQTHTHTHTGRETKLHTQTVIETETGSSQGAPTGGDKRKAEKKHHQLRYPFCASFRHFHPHTHIHIYTHSPNCEADSATLQKGVG